MRTKILALMLAFMPFSNVFVNGRPVKLSIIDPTENQDGSHKGPVLAPELSLEDYTLTFSTPCYGWTLTLVDENDDVAYTTIITSDTLTLPPLRRICNPAEVNISICNATQTHGVTKRNGRQRRIENSYIHCVWILAPFYYASVTLTGCRAANPTAWVALTV